MKISSFIVSAAATLALVGVSNGVFGANDAPTAPSAASADDLDFDSNEVDDSVYETLSTLLDVKEGESADYYRDRWAAIQKAIAALPDDAKSREFFEKNETKAQIAFQTIFKYLADDEKTSKDKREMYFEFFASGLAEAGKVDELNALLKKYSAEKDGNPERAKTLGSLIWDAKIQALAADDAEGLERLGDELQTAALADEAFAAEVVSRQFATRFLKKNREAGGRVVAKLCAAFAASDSEALQKLGKDLEASARFANLVGNEMKVEGLLLDGKTEIDWASYRGKVVLVDFWATWCGPCVGEIPNVQKMYEKYNAAGFDVLGYSLDDNLDALKKFEETKKLPWKTASQKLSVDAKKYVDLAEYYAIYGIPTMIFVGKDGKVLDTNARGERLQELLKEQFPDVK